MDFALIGNCQTAALIDRRGRIIWWCFPRFDSDPVFSRLLAGDEEKGFCEVALADRRGQNAVLAQHRRRRDDSRSTRAAGRCASSTSRRVSIFRPHLPRAADRPADRADRRAAAHHHQGAADLQLRRAGHEISVGSHHIRYISGGAVVRLTTDAPISYIAAETSFPLHRRDQPRLRPGRTVSRCDRRNLPRVSRPHLRTLARMDARAQRAVRVAGGRGARGDYAQAVRLRGHRRHRRRPHDVDPRGAGQRRAIGTTAIAGCATPSSSSRRSIAWARRTRWNPTSTTSPPSRRATRHAAAGAPSCLHGDDSTRSSPKGYPAMGRCVSAIRRRTGPA